MEWRQTTPQPPTRGWEHTLHSRRSCFQDDPVLPRAPLQPAARCPLAWAPRSRRGCQTDAWPQAPPTPHRAPARLHLARVGPLVQVAGTQHAGRQGPAVHARAVAELGAEQGNHRVPERVRPVGCGRQMRRWRGAEQGPRKQGSKRALEAPEVWRPKEGSPGWELWTLGEEAGVRQTWGLGAKRRSRPHTHTLMLRPWPSRQKGRGEEGAWV